jgi:hypothetical protein
MLAVIVSAQCSQMLRVSTANFQFIISKVKFTLEHAMKTQGWSFNLGAGWGRMVNATPQPLYPQNGPVTNWVGPRAGQDGCGKFASTGIRSPDPSVRSYSLYQLSYPGRRLYNQYRRKIILKKVGFMNFWELCFSKLGYFVSITSTSSNSACCILVRMAVEAWLIHSFLLTRKTYSVVNNCDAKQISIWGRSIQICIPNMPMLGCILL